MTALPHLAIPLILTIVLELLMLRLLGERRGVVLLSSVLINIATNIPLNLYVLYNDSSLPTMICAEVLIIITEALCYWLVIKNYRQACIYSLLCNAFSLLTGILIALLLTCFHVQL